MDVKQWIELEPLDTLFLRGSEPMIAGENHEVSSLFPPMPPTIVGALRTAIMIQHGLDPHDFTKKSGPSEVIRERFPLLGEPRRAGFEALGPLFQVTLPGKDSEWFFPAPASWFAPDTHLEKPEASSRDVPVHSGDTLSMETVERLGLRATVANPVWGSRPKYSTMQSVSGHWVNWAALKGVSDGEKTVALFREPHLIEPGRPAMVALGALFGNETRIGIGLEKGTRRVLTGRLYAANHVRLAQGVLLGIGLSAELIPDYLEPEGILQLGGEGRIARYAVSKASPRLPHGTTDWIMTLCPYPYARLVIKGLESYPRASGSLIRIGGWDMQEGFHKPMEAYLPAGTVVKAPTNVDIPFGFVRI